MIYCVVPRAMAEDLYDKLADYYRDDPNVKVIVDRREPVAGEPPGPRPADRDGRRRRVKGTFPPLDPPG